MEVHVRLLLGHRRNLAWPNCVALMGLGCRWYVHGGVPEAEDFGEVV